MISLEHREAIRRAYFVDDKSMRQIARDFHCSRKTITKAIASAEPAPYILQTPRPSPVLDGFKARIEELILESESCLPDPDHLTVLVRSVVVRAAYSLPLVPGFGLPSASLARCDGPEVMVSHHHMVNERLVAHGPTCAQQPPHRT